MSSDPNTTPNRKLDELRAQLGQTALGATDPASFSADDLRRSIRKRLNRANRIVTKPTATEPPPVPEAKPPAPAPAKPITMGRLPGRSKPTTTHPRPESARPQTTLEALAPGNILPYENLPCWCIETPLTQLGPDDSAVNALFIGALTNPGSGLIRWLAKDDWHNTTPPDQVIFMDIETTGLSTTPLFLIGILVWDDRGLVCRQFLARNYEEERAVVGHYLESLENHRLLVTFNGKSFDSPYIHARAATHGIRWQPERHHLDLLFIARRLWRDELPNCRLQTLEAAFCNRSRQGDIPGGRIPKAYHDFVRSGDATSIATILQHNLLDLITLAELSAKLPPPDQHGQITSLQD